MGENDCFVEVDSLIKLRSPFQILVNVCLPFYSTYMLSILRSNGPLNVNRIIPSKLVNAHH